MLERFSAKPHPHIVCIRNFFQEEDNYCLVMDFVDGETLFEVVRRRGRIPEKEAVKYIKQIGSALGDLHKVGAVHRDAHPGNIMIEDGKAILIDFGIAKDLTPNTQTSSGNVGNRGFAPYEQLVKGSREPNVDVYCLAATFYFILTGQRPTNSLDRKLNNTRLIPPREIIPSVSKEFDRAIFKGMALEAEDRTQNMKKWLKILIPATPVIPPYLAETKSSKNFHSDLEPVEKDLAEFIRKIFEEQIIYSSESPPSHVPDSLTESINIELVARSKFYKAPQLPTKKTELLRKDVTTKRKIPWGGLVAIAITYAIVNFLLASLEMDLYFWLLYWAVTVTLAFAVPAAVVFALLIPLFAVAVPTAVVFTVSVAVASSISWTRNRLESKLFSTRDSFLVMSLTSSVGIGLGRLAWYLYSVLNYVDFG